jgi:starvation-inducible outer membrane lipoprotein
MIAAVMVASMLSACSSIPDEVQNTVSDAVAPVRDAIDEAAMRANAVGEGINDVAGGIKKVKGALGGSGATW